MSEEKREQERSKFFSIKSFGKSLGPGVITGASEDDPSGIATILKPVPSLVWVCFGWPYFNCL